MAYVPVRNGNIEAALKQLRQQTQREGHHKERRLREYYMKPSELRKQKQKQAMRRRRKFSNFQD